MNLLKNKYCIFIFTILSGIASGLPSHAENPDSPELQTVTHEEANTCVPWKGQADHRPDRPWNLFEQRVIYTLGNIYRFQESTAYDGKTDAYKASLEIYMNRLEDCFLVSRFQDGPIFKGLEQ